MRVNPLAKVDANTRRKLREERDAARRDTRLKARFLSYRMNVPTADESELLLSVDDFELGDVAARRDTHRAAYRGRGPWRRALLVSSRGRLAIGTV